MTPGYQYLDPPGFSSTYFQVTTPPPAAGITGGQPLNREQFEVGTLSKAVEVPLAHPSRISGRREPDRAVIPDSLPRANAR